MSTETQVKERPILFSGPMVSALLADTKTQTRRDTGLDFINENPGCWQRQWVPAKDGKHWLFTCGDDRVQLRCPYGVEGDRLWVRETWRIAAWRENEAKLCVDYAASPEVDRTPWIHFDREVFDTYHTQTCDELTAKGVLPDTNGRYEWPRGQAPTRWRPSIHMPRAASRLLLEVVSVRVERLKDISEADARAEGYSGFMDFYALLSNEDKEACDLMNEDVDDYARRKGINYPIEWYHMLWDEINGYGEFYKNPWVWVVEFRRVDAQPQEGCEEPQVAQGLPV